MSKFFRSAVEKFRREKLGPLLQHRAADRDKLRHSINGPNLKKSTIQWRNQCRQWLFILRNRNLVLTTGCRPPLSSTRGKAGRNKLNEEITPLLPTGIGERCSQTMSNLGHASLLRLCELPLYVRKCWTNSGGPLVNSVLCGTDHQLCVIVTWMSEQSCFLFFLQGYWSKR